MTNWRARRPQHLDATEDSALWAELVDSESRLRAILNATGVAIVCTDDQLTVTEFSPAAERIFGRRAADVVGRRYSELFPPPLREKVDRDLSRVLDGKAIRLFENGIMDPTGHTCIVLWDIRRLVAADGRTLGVVAAGHDITARQHTEPLT